MINDDYSASAIVWGPSSPSRAARRIQIYRAWGVNPKIWISRNGYKSTNRLIVQHGCKWVCRDQLLRGNVESIDTCSSTIAGACAAVTCEVSTEMLYFAVERMQFDRFRRPIPLDMKRRYIDTLLTYWRTLITTEGIEWVIWPYMPHEAWSLCLYRAAKECQCQTVLFPKIGVKDLREVCTTISDRGAGSGRWRSVKNDHAAKDTIPSDTTAATTEAISSLIERVTSSSYASAEPFYMKRQRDYSNRRNWILFRTACKRLTRVSSRNFSSGHGGWLLGRDGYERWAPSLFESIAAELRRRRFLRKLKSAYAAQCRASAGDGRSAIVVFLHYQPECTTLPEAGPTYFAQERIIRTLLEFYPKEIPIHIREHPSTFKYSMSAHLARDLAYYKGLGQLSPRVKFVPLNVNPFTLISRSRAIATATGTVGLEAALRGTPAIVFGYAWYRRMERVHSVLEDTGLPTLDELEAMRSVNGTAVRQSLIGAAQGLYVDPFEELPELPKESYGTYSHS